MFLNPHFFLEKRSNGHLGSACALPFGPQILFMDAMIVRDQMDPLGVLSHFLFGYKGFFVFKRRVYVYVFETLIFVHGCNNNLEERSNVTLGNTFALSFRDQGFRNSKKGRFTFLFWKTQRWLTNHEQIGKTIKWTPMGVLSHLSLGE